MFKVAACLYDRCTRTLEEAGLSSWREELLSTLHGEVLEIGAGTGHNVSLYPKSVTSIVLSEPDRNMRSVLLSSSPRLCSAPCQAGADKERFALSKRT